MCADMLHKSEGLLGTVRLLGSSGSTFCLCSSDLLFFNLDTCDGKTINEAAQHVSASRPPSRLLSPLARPPYCLPFFYSSAYLAICIHAPCRHHRRSTTGEEPPPHRPGGRGAAGRRSRSDVHAHRVETHGTFFIFRTQHKTQTQSFSHINIIDSTISFDRQLDTTTATTTFPQP